MDKTKQEKFAIDTTSQRLRLLAALRVGPVSTIEARTQLDILMPASRIFELRALGYNIELDWVFERTSHGIEHKIGRYFLIEDN